MASNTWVSDTLTPNLSGAGNKAAAYLAKTTAYYSLRTEVFAKSKAKWRDRTGNARSGLSADYEAQIRGDGGGTYTINLYHRVPYGIWLEVRWGGKYGIINHAIESEGTAFFKAANDLMANMFGGK